MHRTNFIPRIFLCGDLSEFLAGVAVRPFKIIRHVKTVDELDLKNFDALKKLLLGGDFDYLVFTKLKMFAKYHEVAYMNNLITSKAVTLEQFNALPREFYYDPNIALRLLEWLKPHSVKTLLDVDGFFADAGVFTSDEFTTIDCVTEKTLPPIAENIYRRVYKNLSEVGFKHYDAIFLVERDPTDFESMLMLTENFSDKIFTFGRTDSPLEKHLFATSNRFTEARGIRLLTGNLFYVKFRKPPENFCTYVVTYKNIKLAEPPEGYRIIQAGHAVNADTGYLGDDTGDNISNLNVYLNELTALYWIWKNSSASIVGLCHYRRFFTTGDENFSRDKILTKDDALKILETHDIIVSRLFYGTRTQREFIENDCGEKLTKLCDAIYRKHLSRVQPDYLEAFDFVLKSKAIYRCHLIITRREILDAYCKWLFSFLLDVTKEAVQTLSLEKLPFSPRRLVAFFAERLLMTWLLKQHLRIKELNFMFIEGI